MIPQESLVALDIGRPAGSDDATLGIFHHNFSADHAALPLHASEDCSLRATLEFFPSSLYFPISYIQERCDKAKKNCLLGNKFRQLKVSPFK